jgi:hypothetical protein
MTQEQFFLWVRVSWVQSIFLANKSLAWLCVIHAEPRKRRFDDACAE